MTMTTLPYQSAQEATAPRIRDFIALTKPRITMMVLFTCAVGMWLSGQRVSVSVILSTLLLTAAVVGAANVFNCWLERDIDKKMVRTADRPLPAGRVAPGHAVALGIVLTVVAVPLLWVMVNPLTALLGALALVSYSALYTPLKGMTPMALYVGAVPGAIPPLLGWTAATGSLDMPGVVLFLIMFIWQVPHFLAISMFRGPDYAAAGLKVAPVVWGERAAKWQAAISAPVLAGVSLLLYTLGIAGPIYLATAAALGAYFSFYSIRLLFIPTGAATLAWSRRTFFASLIYLTVLFAALLCDARV